MERIDSQENKTIILKNAIADTLKDCIDRYLRVSLNSSLFCNFTFDSYLCWPPTEANTIVRQPCPKLRLSDPSHFASRFCGPSGKWTGRPGSDAGWTNYTSCLPSNVQSLVADIIEDDNKYSIIYATRYLEISGLLFSLLCLLTSIYIFTSFTILRNTRTRIHTNLFGAMIAQVVSQLVIYLDQLFNGSDTGIAYTPIVCETCYIIMEWANTSMFSWMLVEGIYLRYLNSGQLMQRFQFNCYCYFAWGMPFVFTVLWTAFTLKNYNNECWFGYNFDKIYWIMQAPRFMVVMVNLSLVFSFFCGFFHIKLINILILIFILKELYSKLQESKENAVKIKISIKAALILIPLLGIINILNMIDIPVSTSSWIFAIWSYTTHFLRSFQGAFLAIYYCFLNREVQGTLKRKAKGIILFEDINERLASRRRKSTNNHLLATEPNHSFLAQTAQSPPLRTNDEGGKQGCGCPLRFDLHQRNCSLGEPSKLDSDTKQDVNTTSEGDGVVHDGDQYTQHPPTSNTRKEIVVKVVISPDIHQPPSKPDGVLKTTVLEIEVKETTV